MNTLRHKNASEQNGTPQEDEIYSVKIEHRDILTFAEAYYEDGLWYTQGTNQEVKGKVTIL
jgi:hypothetical protein